MNVISRNAGAERKPRQAEGLLDPEMAEAAVQGDAAVLELRREHKLKLVANAIIDDTE